MGHLFWQIISKTLVHCFMGPRLWPVMIALLIMVGAGGGGVFHPQKREKKRQKVTKVPIPSSGDAQIT